MGFFEEDLQLILLHIRVHWDSFQWKNPSGNEGKVEQQKRSNIMKRKY